MIMLIALFFMWGFVTCMNDILIPHFKALFQLSYFEAMLVQFSFFGAYFIGSLAYFVISYVYKDPINVIGYKGGILLGLSLSAAGCFLFYPAASIGIYGIFLFGLFVLGLGFTLLQISANAYVTLLGSTAGASSRLNLAQGFNSLGTTLAPILGGYLMFELFTGTTVDASGSTGISYILFGLLFLLFATKIYFTKLPEFKSTSPIERGLGALAFPQLRAGIFGIFFYVGAEVAIGSFIISFINEPDVLGAGEYIGKNYLALYWGGAMIGRFAGAIWLNGKIGVARRIVFMIAAMASVFLLIYTLVDIPFGEVAYFLLFMLANCLIFMLSGSYSARVLMFFALANIALICCTIFGQGAWSLWSLIAVGLFNSVMWSNVFTLGIHGLGKHTGQGASLLVMGILGGALVPIMQGLLADVVGLRQSFWIPGLCYVYVAVYGSMFIGKKKIVSDLAVRGH
ncbi:sugar MFS transporter [Sphingobacterium chuzhouense]|uniref:Sugar MFS transporter n=2 Tax=Sphingobacterium chuzhouense TaxID=1742264 RepID=A0ABR7XU20_9SPHI|nr:sugar MFS transporter [Sphingobacterium chuzhouense]